MANDSLSGVLLAAFLADYIKSFTNQYWTYRFIFVPETSWLGNPWIFWNSDTCSPTTISISIIPWNVPIASPSAAEPIVGCGNGLVSFATILVKLIFCNWVF